MDNFKTSIISTKAITTGVAYIKSHPKLLKYIIFPILLNFIIFFIFIFLVFNLFNFLWVKFNIETNGFLENLIKVLFLIASAFISVYTFNTISGIVNGPFYDSLIENIFENEGLTADTDFSIKKFIFDIKKSILSEIKKLVLSIFIFLLAIIVNVIPILGQILFVVINIIGFIVFNSLNLYDPMFNRENIKFRERLRAIAKNPFTFWPNAVISGFLTSIPFLNLITLPFAITGAILHYIEFDKRKNN